MIFLIFSTHEITIFGIYRKNSVFCRFTCSAMKMWCECGLLCTPVDNSQGDIMFCPCPCVRLSVRASVRRTKKCNQLLLEFSSNQSETLHRCYQPIMMCMWLFEDEKKKRQNHGVFDFDNFEVRLQYRIASLCNQLLPDCSSNQFEKLHRCCKHIEDVRATFNGRKIIFDKISVFPT